MQTDKKDIVSNSKISDSSSKIIFEDNILCSQFLRDYIELPYFKDIQPEDIEDVSEQYVPLFAEERNADRVKKVSIRKENPFFLVSLIEHKSVADYNVSMQIFRYMVYIWETYAKEAEKLHKGITKQAEFKFPPILPIVYYEGSGKWTVPLDFKSRIMEGDTFGKYIPDFEYYLVPLRKYSNEDLLDKKDEISLVMLINRMQNNKDVESFRRLPAEKVDEILKKTPEHLLDIISNILRAFLLKMNLPEDETEELVGKVKEKKMGYLFENMEKIDIQEERRIAAEARKAAEEAKQELEEAKQELEEAKREAKQEVEEAKKEAKRVVTEAERAAKIAVDKAVEYATMEAKKETAEAMECANRAAQYAKQTEEKGIRLFIEGYQELAASKKLTQEKLIEKFGLSEQDANAKIVLYWKEQS